MEAGSGLLRPRPKELAPPHPLHGVLRVKRRAGRAKLLLRRTRAERGHDGAGGLAGAQSQPWVLGAWRSNPYSDLHLARDLNPDPARPGPRPRLPGRWTTPTSIRTTRAWRPWRRPPTATSAPAASPEASNTAPCGPPSPRPGRPARRSAPPTARLALYATTSPRPTRQVSPAPSQSSLQMLRNLHPLPYSAGDCDCPPRLPPSLAWPDRRPPPPSAPQDPQFPLVRRGYPRQT